MDMSLSLTFRLTGSVVLIGVGDLVANMVDLVRSMLDAVLHLLHCILHLHRASFSSTLRQPCY